MYAADTIVEVDRRFDALVREASAFPGNKFGRNVVGPAAGRDIDLR